jgi:hypothetical protein
MAVIATGKHVIRMRLRRNVQLVFQRKRWQTVLFARLVHQIECARLDDGDVVGVLGQTGEARPGQKQSGGGKSQAANRCRHHAPRASKRWSIESSPQRVTVVMNPQL